jgi:nucleotide-binding universal stress UspA family protein/GNAT superfamily N-acetyltransferase
MMYDTYERVVFEKILFPTDFSEWGNETGKHLVEIPGVREVVILHVLEPGEGGSSFVRPDQVSLTPEEYAREKLATLKGTLEKEGLIVSLRVVEPRKEVADIILASAKEENVSLIVMAACKKGILGSILLGSVSSSVLLQSRVHVLITRFLEDGKKMPLLFSRLLLPVDLSRPSMSALSLLKEMRGVSEVIILHVYPKHLPGDFEQIDGTLQQMVNSLKDSGIAARRITRYGEIPNEICQVAELEKVSLIMMSRFGQKDYIRNILLGSTSAAVARGAHHPVLILHPHVDLSVETRELSHEEFGIAEEIWQHYHQLKADPELDHIFCVFVEAVPVAVARCRIRPDGREVDGVFTLDEFRNRGYARMAVRALVDTFKNETLYMHSTLELVDFYRSFGFRPIPEEELPPSIRERYSFAEGNLQGANVCPMKRVPEHQE